MPKGKNKPQNTRTFAGNTYYALTHTDAKGNEVPVEMSKHEALNRKLDAHQNDRLARIVKVSRKDDSKVNPAYRVYIGTPYKSTPYKSTELKAKPEKPRSVASAIKLTSALKRYACEIKVNPLLLDTTLRLFLRVHRKAPITKEAVNEIKEGAHDYNGIILDSSHIIGFALPHANLSYLKPHRYKVIKQPPLEKLSVAKLQRYIKQTGTDFVKTPNGNVYLTSFFLDVIKIINAAPKGSKIQFREKIKAPLLININDSTIMLAPYSPDDDDYKGIKIPSIHTLLREGQKLK